MVEDDAGSMTFRGEEVPDESCMTIRGEDSAQRPTSFEVRWTIMSNKEIVTR